MSKQDWRFVGTMGVDAGLCWVGDPCYIADFNDDINKSHKIENWHDFCNLLRDTKQKNEKATTMIPSQAWEFNYKAGHSGLGVCVSTGYGDGSYPVFARIGDEGRCMEVRAIFDEPDPTSDIYKAWIKWSVLTETGLDLTEDDEPFVGDDDHEKGSV